MPERHLQLKAAGLFAGAVLVVGGGIGVFEGVVDESRARDQVEQTLPQPDVHLVADAKAAVPFLERNNTPSFLETRAAVQDVLNKDKAFDAALDDNSLFKRSEKEFYVGTGAFFGGLFTLVGILLREEQKKAKINRNWKRQIEKQEAIQ